MSVLEKEIPQDWYRTAFADTADMAWTDRTEKEVERAMRMLKPQGGERILDLACGSGRHSLELKRHGFEVVGADISPELLEIARSDAEKAGLEVTFVEADLRDLEFDAVLSDIKMPGKSGIEMVGELRRIRPDTPVVLMTGFGDAHTHAQALRLGATAVLDKPLRLVTN